MKIRKECLPERVVLYERTLDFIIFQKGSSAKRLSTAFDSVTLYGEDPAERPDIFGKIGEAGVSIATLDDMKDLFKGFDLTAKSTSVSMTLMVLLQSF